MLFLLKNHLFFIVLLFFSTYPLINSHNVYGQVKIENFLLFRQGSLMGIEISLSSLPIKITLNQHNKILWLKYNLPKGGMLRISPNGDLFLENWLASKNNILKFDDKNRLSRIGSTKISYLSNGKLNKINKILFQYDSLGKIKKIKNVAFHYRMDNSLKDIGSLSLKYEITNRLRKAGKYIIHYQLNGRIQSIGKLHFHYHLTKNYILKTTGYENNIKIILFWDIKALWRKLQIKSH